MAYHYLTLHSRFRNGVLVLAFANIVNPFALSAAGCEEHPFFDSVLDETSQLDAQLVAWAMIQSSRSAEADACSKRMLLESAFRRAINGPPASTRYVGPPESSAEVILGIEHGPALDRVTLQLESIAGFTELDPGKAVGLLKQLEPPDIAPGHCGSSILPDVEPAYDALGRVLKQLLQAGVLSETAAVEVIGRFINQTHTSGEMAAASKLLTELPLSGQQKEELIALCAGVLSRMTDGEPDFTAAVIEDRLAVRISRLAAISSSPARLLMSYRDFVIRNRSPQCPELVRFFQRTRTFPGSDYIAVFNELLVNLERAGLVSPNILQPLSEPTDQTLQTNTTPSPHHILFESGEGKTLYETYVAVLAKYTDPYDGSLSKRDSDLSAALASIREYAGRMKPQDFRQLLAEPGSMYRNLLDSVRDPEWQRHITSDYVWLLDRACASSEADDVCMVFFRQLASPSELDSDLRVSRRKDMAAITGISLKTSQLINLALQFDTNGKGPQALP